MEPLSHDRSIHTTPLGVRFWDPVSRKMISDGLRVAAYPVENPRLRKEAFPNPSGVYAFHNLPGLRDFELREIKHPQQTWKDVDPLTRPFARKRFIVEVTDNQSRRFLPFLLNVGAPVQGLLPWRCDVVISPPANERDFVPLYSASTRHVPVGMAAIRAQLWDPTPPDGRPAAWARLEAHFQGAPLAKGIADAEGRIVLIFPYPEPSRMEFQSPAGSPGGMAGIPLRSQEWQIDLQAFYDPDPSPPEMIDLGSTLCKQQAATLWSDEGRTHPLTSVAVQYGAERVLRTQKAIEGTAHSELYITSAGSPP